MEIQVREYRLSDAQQYHTFFQGYRSHGTIGWWFRGQADIGWKLLPKAARVDYALPAIPGARARHLGRFRAWSTSAIAYDPTLPTNDWERLAVAQHHGLATCLLDWTTNPLVALFFCCSERPSIDGSVYMYQPSHFLNVNEITLNDEMNALGVGFIPRSVTSRIVNQRAVFSVHLPPATEIEVQQHPAIEHHPNLVRLIVPAIYKADILSMLDVYGINHVGLFPDLEGLSRYVNWETSLMASVAIANQASAPDQLVT